jgi:hypothetical protein
MKLDQSRDDKVAKVINLVGFSTVGVSAVGMLVYFWSQSEHPLRDVLSWLTITLVTGLLLHASRSSRARPQR